MTHAELIERGTRVARGEDRDPISQQIWLADVKRFLGIGGFPSFNLFDVSSAIDSAGMHGNTFGAYNKIVAYLISNQPVEQPNVLAVEDAQTVVGYRDEATVIRSLSESNPKIGLGTE